MRLPSGLMLERPLNILLAFCGEEYDYYDAIPSRNPNDIEPIDVLVTISVNSFINNAKRVRQIHRDLASTCGRLLKQIPNDADILTFDPAFDSVERLLHTAVQSRNVLIPVATKVLHRKRRFLIPMLDNVLIEYYLTAKGRRSVLPSTQDKRHAAKAARLVMADFRDDLEAVSGEIATLTGLLAQEGYSLSPIRILEILIWTSIEPTRHYRNISP